MTTAAEKLLDRLDSVREQMLVALDTLPDEALLAPDTVGAGSVADLLVQLTVWESELVTGLMRISQGKKPARLLVALNNAEEYSRLRRAENKGRDLDRIFADWPQVRVQLEEWLQEFSERQLQQKGHYVWLKHRSLAELIAQVTYEQELRYLPQIEALAQKWLARTDEETIWLTPKENSHDSN